MTGAGDILDRAKQLVTGDRAATHGPAEQSFARVAGLWSALIGVEITPPQAALMMAALKVSRGWDNPGHADNAVDLAGYAALAGQLAGGRRADWARGLLKPETVGRDA